MTFPALSKKDEYDELTVPAYLYKRLLNLLQEEWAKRRCSPACWSLGSTSLCALWKLTTRALNATRGKLFFHTKTRNIHQYPAILGTSNSWWPRPAQPVPTLLRIFETSSKQALTELLYISCRIEPDMATGHLAFALLPNGVQNWLNSWHQVASVECFGEARLCSEGHSRHSDHRAASILYQFHFTSILFDSS